VRQILEKIAQVEAIVKRNEDLYVIIATFEFLEYSQPCGYSKVQGFDDFLDDKQINISHFKRGMGASVKTIYRGIKYYDKKLLIKDIENFKERVKVTI